MPVDEFLRRFLLHVLPHGFRKIRHYGLLAPGAVGTRLPEARALLEPRPPDLVPVENAGNDSSQEADDEVAPRCPACGGRSASRFPLGVFLVPLDSS